MNATILAKAIRELADEVQAKSQRESDADNVGLLRVLARIVEGKPVARAFGAPGDWGYNTHIGQALAAAPAAKNPESAQSA